MEEKNGDLADGVKRIKGEVKKLSKETIGGIATGIAVVVGMAWADMMKALFAWLSPEQKTLVTHFGYAIFATIVAVFVARWAKKHSEQPPANPSAG